MRKFLVSLLAAAAIIAPASAAQARPTPHHGPHYGHHQAWGHGHNRYDARKDTLAVIYVDKNFWVGLTTVKARDYTAAMDGGPNLAIVPDVHYRLFRDGVYVMSGMTVGGWTAPYMWKNDVSVHKYTYKFSGNRVVEPVTVSLTQ